MCQQIMFDIFFLRENLGILYFFAPNGNESNCEKSVNFLWAHLLQHALVLGGGEWERSLGTYFGCGSY